MQRFRVHISETSRGFWDIPADSGQEALIIAANRYDHGDTSWRLYDEPFAADDESCTVDMDVEKLDDTSPYQLPVVERNGKQYFRDDRLKEYRAVNDPHDRLSF
jgi:hypothetical protein